MRTNERITLRTTGGRRRTAYRQAVLSRCSGIWVSSVGGEGCEQAEHERRAGEGEQRIVKQCFLGAQALGLVLLVEKDANKGKTNKDLAS